MAAWKIIMFNVFYYFTALAMTLLRARTQKRLTTSATSCQSVSGSKPNLSSMPTLK